MQRLCRHPPNIHEPIVGNEVQDPCRSIEYALCVLGASALSNYFVCFGVFQLSVLQLGYQCRIAFRTAGVVLLIEGRVELSL